MKLLIILVAVTYTWAFDCSEGQVTWCSSLRAAKQCGAFNHCKDTVWKNLQLAEDNSDVCDFCKSVIGDVQKMITDKQTQAAIQNVLRSACTLVPDATMREECTKVINDDLPELLLLISEELDPSLVCSTFGLCATHDVFKMLWAVDVKPVKTISSGDICSDCKAFFGDMKAEITSKTTEQQLEQQIEGLFCANLGELAQECNSLVEQYVPELLQMLAADFDPAQECSALGFCAATPETRLLLPKLRLAKSPLYKKLQGNDEFCDDCKAAFSDAQAFATSEQFETIVSGLMTQLCNSLGQYKEVCVQTIDQYLPEILKMIASEINPAQDCEMLGLCSAQSYPLIDVQPVEEVEITPQDIAAMQQSGPRMTRVDASVECILCEFVMNRLDSLLTENSTETEIIAALDKVCSLLPSSVASECDAFVNTYGPAVLALLQQELKPSEICATLGLCASSNVVKAPPPAKASDACALCEVVMQYVDSLLSNNRTEAEIEQVLDKVCHYLPETYQSECLDIVKQYAPLLVKLLMQELTPEEICKEIGLCNAKVTKPQQAQLLGIEECTWGPGYWCASAENANRCNAREHCEKHVWN